MLAISGVVGGDERKAASSGDRALRLALSSLLLLACGGTTRSDPGAHVLCDGQSNPELESAIRNYMSLDATSPLPADKLATLTYLPTRDLKTLDGIQCLPKLNQLLMVNSSVTDLAPLGALSLTSLDIDRSTAPRLESLSQGSSAPSATLTQLTVTQSGLSDLAGLAALQGLVMLDLSYNALSRLDGMPMLPQLTTLNLAGNALAELEPLRVLPALTDLNVNENHVASLSTLNGHPALKKVTAHKNQLVSLDGLQLPSLDTLDAGANQIHDVGLLAGAAQIRYLSLSENRIATPNGLKSLVSLDTLDLSLNPITDLNPLSAVSNLHVLNLSGTAASDLAPLSGLTGVSQLDLTKSHVIDLAPLGPWAKLGGNCREIDVSGLLVDSTSRDLVAPSLCRAGWDVRMICAGSCDPHP